MAGRVCAFTGDGKGKTTAALGMALRAVGHGMRVLVVQFVKDRRCGEHAAAELLGDLLEVRRMGAGFLKEGDPESLCRAREAAQEALAAAGKALMGSDYQMVVLDEVLYAVSKALIRAADVRAAVESRRPDMHVVLTGRGLSAELAELADTVTEMCSIKYGHRKGLPMTRGIEY